jgi:hypothetical protein
VLGASADGLDGGPHIFVAGHQVPARGEELTAFDAAAFVDAPGLAGEEVVDAAAPGDVAVALDDGMALADLEGFLGEERGVNASVDDGCSALAGHAADGVSAQGVAGVDADAYDVSGVDALRDDLLEGLIDEDGVAGGAGRCGGEDEQPSRGNYSRAK